MGKKQPGFSLFQNELVQFLLANLTVLALFIITSQISYSTYTTTDDVLLMQRLSGCFNSAPVDWASFLSPIVCKVVAGLYRTFPGYPWYVILQIVLIFASCVTILWCILKKCRGKYPLALGYLLFAVLYLAAYGWVLLRMHFYYVAVMAGAASIALILTTDYRQKAETVVCGLGIVFFAGVTFAYSLDIGYVFLCYMLLGIVYRVIMAWTEKKSRVLSVITGFVLIAVITLAFQGSRMIFKSARLQVNGKEYVEWNTYRVSFWDYPTVDYDENPELYQSVGWTREFYALAKKMYFMDERFETEELSQITTKFNRIQIVQEDRTLHDTLVTGKALFKSNREAKALFVLMWGLLAASFLCFKPRKTQVFKLLASVCAFGGAGILCLYLAFRGRFPLRSFVPIAGFCITFMMINLLELADWKIWKEKKSKMVTPVITVLCFVLLLGSLAYSIRGSYLFLTNEKSKEYYAECWKKENTVYSYVQENKNNIYIYDQDMMGTYDPYMNLPAGSLSNLFCWGGARTFTAAYYNQLRLNGRVSLYSDAYLDSNVYLLTSSVKNVKLLLAFLHDQYSANACVVVDEPGSDVLVCKYLDSYDAEEWKTAGIKRGWYYDGGKLKEFKPE